MRRFPTSSSFADVRIVFAERLHLEDVQLSVDSFELFLRSHYGKRKREKQASLKTKEKEGEGMLLQTHVSIHLNETLYRVIVDTVLQYEGKKKK